MEQGLIRSQIASGRTRERERETERKESEEVCETKKKIERGGKQAAYGDDVGALLGSTAKWPARMAWA